MKVNDISLLITSHPIPKIESLDPSDDLNGSHDGVDDCENTANESKDDGDGDTEDSEKPETEWHEVRIFEKLFFHCNRIGEENTLSVISCVYVWQRSEKMIFLDVQVVLLRKEEMKEGIFVKHSLKMFAFPHNLFFSTQLSFTTCQSVVEDR